MKELALATFNFRKNAVPTISIKEDNVTQPEIFMRREILILIL
jgi:hypothetical protein